LAGITRNISQTANKELLHYIHSYSVKHSDIMVITPSNNAVSTSFLVGIIYLNTSKQVKKKKKQFAEKGIFFHRKPSLFPTKQYKPM
jgi:hypothetical protein